VKRCSSCGTDNLDRSRFCEQCGSKLPDPVAAAVIESPAAPDPEAEARARAEARERAAAGLPPTFMPPPVQPSFAPSSGWKTDDIVDEPKKKKRRIFLWVLGGILLLCILVCVGSILFLEFTDTGQRFVNDMATRAAEAATEQAGSDALASPTP
jgi:hypothetical protein